MDLEHSQASGIGGTFAGIEQILGGSSGIGSDTLAGPDAATIWNVTGTNAGTVAGLTFTDFENLTGGSGPDTFAFADGARVTGLVDGSGGDDTLDLSAYTTPTTWNVTADSAGTMTGAGGPIESTSIENLVGGSGADRFILGDGVILRSVDGGPGMDLLDLSAYTVPNLWGRTGDDGTVETARGTLAFTSIENRQGSGTSTYRYAFVDLVGAFSKMALPATALPGARGVLGLVLTNRGNVQMAVGGVARTKVEMAGSANRVNVGTWAAGSLLAVGVVAGSDGYFSGDEGATGGTLGSFRSLAFDTANGGTLFGIAADGLTGHHHPRRHRPPGPRSALRQRRPPGRDHLGACRGIHAGRDASDPGRRQGARRRRCSGEHRGRRATRPAAAATQPAWILRQAPRARFQRSRRTAPWE